MNILNKLKGLFKHNKRRKKEIIKHDKTRKTANKKGFGFLRKRYKKKNVQNFQDDLFRHKVNERRKKNKVARKSRAVNRGK